MFNKRLLKIFAGRPAQPFVPRGKWTFDVSHQMMVVVTDDINGDGKMTPDADRYGLATHDVNYYALMIVSAASRWRGLAAMATL